VEVAISAEMIDAVAQAQVQEAQAEQAKVKSPKVTPSKSPKRQPSSSAVKAVTRSKIIFSEGSGSPGIGTNSPSSGLARKNVAEKPSAQLAGTPAKGSEATKPKRVRGAGLFPGQEAASDADNESATEKPRQRAVPVRQANVADKASAPLPSAAQGSAKVSTKRKSAYHNSAPTEESAKGTGSLFAASIVPDVAISQEELEAKSSAALQSLRSMKLKKVRLDMKVSSLHSTHPILRCI
jgi:hypothetical protein